MNLAGLKDTKQISKSYFQMCAAVWDDWHIDQQMKGDPILMVGSIIQQAWSVDETKGEAKKVGLTLKSCTLLEQVALTIICGYQIHVSSRLLVWVDSSNYFPGTSGLESQVASLSVLVLWLLDFWTEQLLALWLSGTCLSC